MAAPSAAELKERLARLTEAWDASHRDPDTLADELERLADHAREPSWRIPLGESGILAFALNALGETKDDVLSNVRTQCLRLVGNSCIDTDENRNVALKRFDAICSELRPDGLTLCATVLNNLLCDYEEGQQKAVELKLPIQLVELLEQNIHKKGDHTAEAAADATCRLLELLSDAPGEAAGAGPSVVPALLEIAASPGLSDRFFVYVASILATYLDNEPQLSKCIDSPEAVLKLGDVFVGITNMKSVNASFDEDDVSRLKTASARMLPILADSTDNASIRLRPPFEDTSVADKFISWLGAKKIAVRAAACLALGNMVRSDDAAKFLVEEKQVHKPLIRILQDQSTPDVQLIHAALSVLKHLSIPQGTRTQLGAEGLLSEHALSRIWESSPSPDAQLGAVSLVRLLISNSNAANAEYLTQPRLEEGVTELSDQSSPKTDLGSLLELHKKTDTPPISMETARAVGIVCRTLHSSLSMGQDKMAQFHATYATIPDALAYLVTQDKFPILRCEAWLVLAIMAQSTVGCAAVTAVFERDGVLEHVRLAATQPAGPVPEKATTGGDKNDSDNGGLAELSREMGEKLALASRGKDAWAKAHVTRFDRQNVMVLLTNLLKNGDESYGRRGELEGLRQEGLALTLKERAD